ncbi:MAG: signal recognition particle-docking protein FtsY [Flavobacteriaceae bacterium]|nr:signal recognition particle-docking protein FtsY [Flavobacteriaceae bacterium]MCY4267848.1 signal recognition particle-docking protein FtsY [Flavobacteriaceae bacterium]
MNKPNNISQNSSPNQYKKVTGFWSGIRNLLSSQKPLNSQLIEHIEELLITADVGIETTEQLVEKIMDRTPHSKNWNLEELTEYFKKEITSLLETNQTKTSIQSPEKESKPFVVLVVGVNGSGKTTTIGKIAHHYKNQNKKVLLGAADTFRSGAIQQLGIWAERVGCRLIKHQMGGDSAAVAYDSVQSAVSKFEDVVIIDTAGRMSHQNHLMEELKKIKRSIQKVISNAPHEVLLVLDGSIGQNALIQAGDFFKNIGITSLAVTKLDGTSKGGMLFSVNQKYNIPIKYIGVGEKMDDLLLFDRHKYVESLFEN